MKKRILSLLPLAVLLAALLCAPAFAITESEVQNIVSNSGKDAVTGNVLIWFLCAVGFLKISQKIDSILSTMGINVGRTGGSLLSDALVAARGVSMLVKAGGGTAGRAAGRAAEGGADHGAASSPSASTGGFFKGGLSGMASRHFSSNSANTAATQASAVHTAQSQSVSSAAHTASSAHTASATHSGGGSTVSSGSVHTDSAVQTATIQSDSSASSSQEHTSSEAQSDAAVFSDAMIRQDGAAISEDDCPFVPLSGDFAPVVQSDGSIQSDHTASPGGHTHTQSGTVQSSHTSTNIQAPQPGGIARPASSDSCTVPPCAATVSQTIAAPTILPNGIGGAAFSRSLVNDVKFANEVIGTVARGETRATGCITGDLASYSLRSYMGSTSPDASAQAIPHYSDVEIGGGRITGTEYQAGSYEGTAFGMYHADQYAAPQGPYEMVQTVDGALWYKQYAQDTVDRPPLAAQDSPAGGGDHIVKKLPTPPMRKNQN